MPQQLYAPLTDSPVRAPRPYTLRVPRDFAATAVLPSAMDIRSPSGYPIFPLIGNWPLTHELVMDNYVADMGDGFEQRANFNRAHSRADGEGTVSSYKGRNKFTVPFNTRAFAADAATLWAFYQSVQGNAGPFYFYNVPDERATIDLTGSDPAGRYRVRFNDPNLTRSKFTLLLFNHSLSLIEVRS